MKNIFGLSALSLCAALVASACTGETVPVGGFDSDGGPSSNDAGTALGDSGIKTLTPFVGDAAGLVPVHVIISNQSYKVPNVDIAVSIDHSDQGHSGSFMVGNQHTFKNFDFFVTPGIHSLFVTSTTTGASLEKTWDGTTEKWLTVLYWDDANTPNQFVFNEYTSPPSFQ